MATRDYTDELTALAYAYEIAREVRRLLTMRLAIVAALTLLLSAVRVLPWIAGEVAASLSMTVVAAALVAEWHARQRVMHAPLNRSLRQNDTQPTAR